MSKRVITGIIMAAVLLAVIVILPDIATKVLLFLLVVAAALEFARMTFPNDVKSHIFLALACAYVAQASLRDVLSIEKLIVVSFVTFLFWMRHLTTLEGFTKKVSLTMLGIVYLGIPLTLWGGIRSGVDGASLVILGLASTAMSDTFAYFVGRSLGRRKFAPLTSPNKTWEGFIAGVFGSTVTAVLIKVLLGIGSITVVDALILGALVGIVGPLGDLVESAIKRDHHVKDSGSIIPGHGGILDRIDAYIFTAPLLYFYLEKFVR